MSLNHFCAAPARPSSAVAGLRRRSPGGVYQLAENPCEALIVGLTILAHLEMSNFLRESYLRDR